MKYSLIRVSLVLAILFTMPALIHSQENEIRNIAEHLSKTLTTGPHRTVAVVDFTDLDSNVTPLGRYIAEELENSLANAPEKLDLVDRTRLQLLIKENKLAATGIIDPATARQLGKIAGVDVLVTGTITPFGDTVRLSIKALDTESARVLAATSRSILKTTAIAQLLGQSPSAPVAGYGNGPTVPQSTTQQTAPQTPPVFESHDIRFTVNYCAREAASIVCGLTITNKSDDTEIWLHNHCNSPARIIDGIGREFQASEVLLGSIRANNCEAQGTLVNGVPTRTEVRFDNVPADVSSIGLLDLPTGLVNNQFVDVTFHRVAITRQRF